MAEERKISPALVIAAGAGIATAAAAGIYALARAVPPEEEIPSEELPPEARPRIVRATWETSFISGGFAGYLVKATIIVDSPVAFTGNLKVSLPGAIAGIHLLNYDEWLAEIARAEQNLAECEGKTGTAYTTCVRGRTLHLERIRKKPSVEEFYPTGVYSDVSMYTEKHRRALDNPRDEEIHTVAWPEGISSFDLAFFLLVDYLYLTYFRIAYFPKTYSPTVELYDEAGNLVDSVLYEDAIKVEAKPSGAYPVSFDFPSTVKSGEEYWAGFTIFLPYVKDCLYRVSLHMEGVGDIAYGEVVSIGWYYNRKDWYLGGGAEPISQAGQFTFRGLLESEWVDDDDYKAYTRVPARAVKYKYGTVPTGEALAPRIYKVTTRCQLKLISYATNTARKYYSDRILWEGVEVGEIEVI